MNDRKIAVISAKGLGDALLSMILSHNLALHCGAQVVTISPILCELKSWFPNHTILSELDNAESYDQVVATDHAGITADIHLHTLILKERDFDRSKTMVANFMRVCQTHFAIPHPTNANGIRIPSSLKWCAYPRRVVIHPTSGHPKKNWSPEKFHHLAEQLAQQGYEPVFCVSPQEREQWPTSPLFPSVDDVTRFIYQSGYFIGNDSGLGHLASLLRVPTLSLFARKGYSHLWRPGWGPGKVITPPSLLPGARLKQKYWCALLSPERVLKAFLSGPLN